MNLIIRILGNDLNGLHGENQTYNNLKFTLANEPEFKFTDKIFLLNRIYDTKKKNKYIKLLKKYNKKYIIDEFDINKFNKLKYLVNKNENNFFTRLYNYNLYLVNNNGSRNFCIEYGKRKNYKWIFALDSNSYFTKKTFYNIIDNIDKDTKYLILPQVRLSNENLNNDDIIGKSDIKFKETFEPQIAFRNNSDIIFNDKIPYGASPKAELLRVLKVPGKWKYWDDNFRIYNIKDRKKEDVKFQILSYVIRLNSYNKNNNVKKNYNNRITGLEDLINQIKKENKLIETFTNNKINNYKINNNITNKDKINNNIKFILLIIVIFLIVIKIFN